MKKKEFFIGIDSDGTAFDSMTIKHTKTFIPKMIEVWNLQEHSEAVFRICEEINLYSKTRGIDRFTGLQVAFDRMKAEGIPVPDYETLAAFLQCGKSLSNDSLANYCKENPSLFLQELLQWSREADALFEKEVKTLNPFSPIVSILKDAVEKADIAVISSASRSSLEIDWKKDRLCDYVTEIYGQEQGKKTVQLKMAAEGKYPKNHALMFGDALGDYEAAQSAGIRFYPIIPGKEEESWLKFQQEYAEIFFSGNYDDKCEERLLCEFYHALHMNQ